MYTILQAVFSLAKKQQLYSIEIAINLIAKTAWLFYRSIFVHILDV